MAQGLQPTQEVPEMVVVEVIQDDRDQE